MKKWFSVVSTLLISCAAAAAQDYKPLPLGDSYRYTLTQIFGPSALARVTANASLDQYDKDPGQWRSDPDGYFERLGSAFGRLAVRENVAFGVRALDGEDPRYSLSPGSGFWRRVAWATKHTFVAQNRQGKPMPALSLLVAEYASPFIAQQWRPGDLDPGRQMRSGTFGVGLTVLQNLGREFWPDIKKKFAR